MSLGGGTLGEVCGVRAEIRRPDIVGALLGKAAVVTTIISQSSDHQATHLRDFDSLIRLLGQQDRRVGDLTKRRAQDARQSSGSKSRFRPVPRIPPAVGRRRIA